MDVWVWVGHMWNERAQLALEQFGDQITDVSIFAWSVDAAGKLTRTFDPSELDRYRARWPHLRFWAAFRNDGEEQIFTALRNGTVAQDRLLADLGGVLTEYPWLTGIDIDLEQGGGIENAPKAEALFARIADLAHSRGKKCAAALPALTSDGSVGGQDWCRYKELGKILDHMEIMSYDFAWMGSAPGPISPGAWMKQVYSWAASQVYPKKISMGLPLYAYYWDLHNYPAALGNRWRGDSGTYYSVWQHFTGVRAQDGSDLNPAGSGSHHRIGWIAFREPESKSAWGFTDVYDWRDGYDWDTADDGLSRDEFEGKPYLVRYGVPSALEQAGMWQVADNSSTDSAKFWMCPRSVRDVNGRFVSPKKGFTVTVEVLRRHPIPATIMDDNAGNRMQLANYYRGAWQQWSDRGRSYHQYRGSGVLNLVHDFTGRSVYMQVRGQFATAGWIGVTANGWTAEVNEQGQLRLRKGQTVVGTARVPARPVGVSAGDGRFVLAVRVRESSVRVYWAANENFPPTVYIKASGTPAGGTVGIVTTATAWIDHVYVGDGWWYHPREAVKLRIGGQERELGRFKRSGITWDANGRFRPNADVDEPETRIDERSISLDWMYDHWVDAPVIADAPTTVEVIASEHDVWVGRVMLVDRDGSYIVYWSDAETIVFWRDRARLDFGLAGIALWSLGQEDIRVWDRLAAGELTSTTRRIDR